VTASASFKSTSIALPVGVLAIAMVSVQVGAALVKGLFPAVGVAGATTLRLAIASVLLAAVWRPWRLRPTAREAGSIVVYGVAMGCMNFCFYSALSRIPLGIAVALEFTGPWRWPSPPLIARSIMFGSLLRRSDFSRCCRWGHGAVSGVGIAFALGAGVCWALYIVFGRKAGDAHGGITTAVGTLIGALVIAPIGVVQAGGSLFNPAVLPAALGVAVLSSALPYSLEMFALTRIPPGPSAC